MTPWAGFASKHLVAMRILLRWPWLAKHGHCIDEHTAHIQHMVGQVYSMVACLMPFLLAYLLACCACWLDQSLTDWLQGN